jgi:hypothetical protein
MATLTLLQEYDAVRQALQAIEGGDEVFNFTLGDMSVSYHADQKDFLQQREIELAKRLTQRNIRKRTFPDFTG